MSKKKPQPISVETVCSECGLMWVLHGSDPTTDDCVRLLKAELQVARAEKAIYPYPLTYPERVFPYGGETLIWNGTRENIEGGELESSICKTSHYSEGLKSLHTV